MGTTTSQRTSTADNASFGARRKAASSKPGVPASGGSGPGGSGLGNGKEKSGGKTKLSKGTKQAGGKQQDQPSVNKMHTTAEDTGKGVSSATSTTSTQKEEPCLSAGQDLRAGEKVEEGQAGTKSSQQSTAAGTGEAESEVTSLLRSMRLNGPRLSAMALKRVERTSNRTTLLDGGATHCRPVASHADLGTLITQDQSVQRIIPIRELVRIWV